MSRNKENLPLPLPSTQRANGSVLSLAKNTPPSEDFFTDSLLDASKIPSPSPQKALYGKPRRAIGNTRAFQLARSSANPVHRSSSPPNAESRSSRKLQPPPTLKRPKSSSPANRQDLVTPPRSSPVPDLTSPFSDLSSPPRGLTDVYQRIADEEDLAATEGELGDDEELDEDLEQEDDGILQEMPTNGQNLAAARQSQTSNASTPVPAPPQSGQENFDQEQVEAMSEASGMSFFEQMTDQRLAAKLTPHAAEFAKSRRIFHKYTNSGPIHFNKQINPSEIAPEQDDWTVRSDPTGDHGAPGAFRLASTKHVNGSDRPFSDSNTDASPPKKPKAFGLAQRSQRLPADENSDDSDTSDELRNIERKLMLSRAARIMAGGLKKSTGSPSTVPTTDGQQSLESHGAVQELSPRHVESEQQSVNQGRDAKHGVASSPVTGRQSPSNSATAPNGITQRNPVPSTGKGVLQLWKRKAAEQRAHRINSSPSQDAPRAELATAAPEDVPIPSVETGHTPQGTPPKSYSPASLRQPKSMDRLRKWENDFTGMSFQVSESPPIRVKTSESGYLRDGEMGQLVQRAVTTNRLEELGEKDAKARQRRISRSPSAGKLPQRQTESNEHTQESQSEVDGEKIPDTPVVIYRSSSHGSAEVKSLDAPQRPSFDKQLSHEQLQRLARAMSSTPRSSPAPTKEIDTTDERVLQPKSQQPAEAEDVIGTKRKVNASGSYSDKLRVMETPKVTGAWTDTILPDTAKTVKQQGREHKYSQTPQVTTGGWVDTPFVGSNRQSSAMAPMTIEEETEEVTADVLPANNQTDDQKQELSEKEACGPTAPVPRSALGNILKEQRERLVTRNTTDVRDDTLNLGDNTIASLEDLVTLDENEMTTLIRMGAEQDALDLLTEAEGVHSHGAEAALLERLGVKLERLRTNINVARKGLSKLEHQVSHPANSSDLSPISPNETDEACAICGRSANGHSHHTFDAFPLAYSTIKLPIPLLLHPRRKDQRQRFHFSRLTILGWLTLALWAWYLTESTMCELYCHPQYADSYSWPSVPEPVFPYVLPTMLSQWTGIRFAPLPLLRPIWTILVAVWRILGMWMGWTDGFVDDARGGGGGGGADLLATATAAAFKAASAAAFGSDGPDLSMMNDEFI